MIACPAVGVLPVVWVKASARSQSRRAPGRSRHPDVAACGTMLHIQTSPFEARDTGMSAVPSTDSTCRESPLTVMR